MQRRAAEETGHNQQFVEFLCSSEQLLRPFLTLEVFCWNTLRPESPQESRNIPETLSLKLSELQHWQRSAQHKSGCQPKSFLHRHL